MKHSLLSEMEGMFLYMHDTGRIPDHISDLEMRIGTFEKRKLLIRGSDVIYLLEKFNELIRIKARLGETVGANEVIDDEIRGKELSFMLDYLRGLK